MKSSYILGALLPLCIIASSYAVTPSTAPDGVSDPGWLFALYFQNIAENPCTSSTDLVTGFLWTQDATYLTPQCTNIGKLIWSFFSAYTNTDTTKVITGFNATTGAPIYATPTTAWKEVTGGITYTGGNVGIGTSTPNSKLHVLGSLNVEGVSYAKRQWPSSAATSWKTGTGDVDSWTWFYNGTEDWGSIGTRTLQLWVHPYDNPSSWRKIMSMSALDDHVTFAWTISAASPTASGDVATKGYVDAAVSAGGGGGLNIYKNDGTTLLWRFLNIAYINDTYTVCEATHYTDGSGHVQTLNRADCIEGWGVVYFPNDNCSWNKVGLPVAATVLKWVFRNNAGIDYGVTTGTPSFSAIWTYTWSYWDFTHNTCKERVVTLMDNGISSNGGQFANSIIGDGTPRHCGWGLCVIK